MKRLFSHPLVALAAGFGLRLLFVLKFPANSGDTVLYEQIAANWLHHGVYAMDVGGQVTPVDLRMPGYPAFLALIYWITGKTGPDARFPVMLAQVFVDLGTCLVIAFLAARLLGPRQETPPSHRVFTVALWLSGLCPFTANYTAVPLTETLTIFFTVLAFLFFVLLLRTLARSHAPSPEACSLFSSKNATALAAAAGLAAGVATLLRPEGPLLLLCAWPLFVAFMLFRRDTRWLRAILISGFACLFPLLPWAARNLRTLHEFQLLAPKNSNLPGELVPYGFMAWEKTWLFRVKDCYLVPWKLNEEAIHVDEIPARAFDTPEEKQRVAALLNQYNAGLTLSPEEDAAFARLARERTARHPLRTYVWLPVARAFVIWFTPRIELLPVSGNVFPLAYNWKEDPVDQRSTVGLFLLNVFYVVLAIWGGRRLWRSNLSARPAIMLFAVFILVRTVFLTTLETPEPRYVLVCYPLLLALAAHVFAGKQQQEAQLSPTGSG